MNIQCFLDKANKNFETSIFESGQCHTFALAFKILFGGKLFAIMRHDAQDDLDWYSHMVVEINNNCYDINGKNADESWCTRFSEDDDFDFLPVQADSLDDFLKKWKSSVDNSLLDQLLNL